MDTKYSALSIYVYIANIIYSLFIIYIAKIMDTILVTMMHKRH